MGEIKDKELIAEHNETRKEHSRELKNAETRIKRLQEINETIFAAGEIKHKDLETMKDIVTSGANSLTIISPLRRGNGSYIHIYNPSPVRVDSYQNRFADDRILNIDQSKAYTWAFDPCMNDLLGTPGKCIGKIQESFLLSSHGEMIGMLEQKGIEGILIIDKESVNFDSVSIEKIKQHVLLINSNINVSYITVEKQYKMWRGIAAMVSYDSIEVKWDEASHVKENGTRHFAKAVGAACQRIQAVIQSFLIPNALELEPTECTAFAKKDLTMKDC
ncbi:hypothetical protein T492DRAFT_839427 [Pavlovales sp. CCMP2436]|nr:hypothetical protein T492DRAFT_839427 [Pavlovales sp. CCMP2436]